MVLPIAARCALGARGGDLERRRVCDPCDAKGPEPLGVEARFAQTTPATARARQACDRGRQVAETWGVAAPQRGFPEPRPDAVDQDLDAPLEPVVRPAAEAGASEEFEKRQAASSTHQKSRAALARGAAEAYCLQDEFKLTRATTRP